ncbi:MAG: RNA polymerase sigma factor [Clostridia bacterium]|nr:RNA polymerase sigma factor [Clostridia bacterium]
MEDEAIIRLFWNRDEKAIEETGRKYLHYLMKISVGVLGDTGEAEECVNDTYLKAWESIPPTRPASLSAYLAAVVRRISISRKRKAEASKRGGTEYDLSLDELGECLPARGGSPVEEEVDKTELARSIGRFLASRSETERHVFVGRYFYLDPVARVASYCGVSAPKARYMLGTMREELKAHLEKEGWGK